MVDVPIFQLHTLTHTHARTTVCLSAWGNKVALYFATKDVEPTQLLAELAAEKGQRAYIGKVRRHETCACRLLWRSWLLTDVGDETIEESRACMQAVVVIAGHEWSVTCSRLTSYDHRCAWTATPRSRTWRRRRRR